MQAGIGLTSVMSVVSYMSFTHEARKKRAAVRKQHSGQLPHLLAGRALTGRYPAASPELQDIPVAPVVEDDSGGEAPVATAESLSAVNSDHEAVLPAAVHAKYKVSILLLRANCLETCSDTGNIIDTILITLINSRLEIETQLLE